MNESTDRIASDFFAAIERGDLEAVRDLYSPRVEVWHNVTGRTQTRDVIGVNGYLAQGDPRAHFGLGPATLVDRVLVRWPDGSVHDSTEVPADQVLTIVQGES